MHFDPATNMINEQADTNERLDELLSLAHKIEYLTRPTKDCDRFD